MVRKKAARRTVVVVRMVAKTHADAREFRFQSGRNPFRGAPADLGKEGKV
jgi:hypothetical protein